ncbi:MAG: SDR family oxidoreductase [Halieaceae bacterium]|uniref:SDR family NAD(P)-dependent oxidoreductase n=1 Tax=Haliea alexandrii TaxID=2448162 RepID=UPI000F0B7871|nr:SDR family NAD(P)-dependent oxidoreductase [Haliea alexandrii]MCR9186159.1 SDR family oxidoreductase [Halieaceae bacterium]
MRLEGKRCIVTGGASGIGEATVRRFVEEGAEVLIADLNLAGAQALAAELDSAVTAVKCDARQEADVRDVATAALERWENVDVLVNNAGIELSKTYEDTSTDEWAAVIDTNLRGPWLFCKYIVPKMVERGAGSVINVSSLNGLVGFPLSTAYGSAKGGLVVFTRDMAIELGPTGVRVNCVCPGVIATPMMERWTQSMPDQAEAQEMLRGTMPIGRLGQASEVASAILFFASDDSTLCQGSVLSVDGGFTAQ